MTFFCQKWCVTLYFSIMTLSNPTFLCAVLLYRLALSARIDFMLLGFVVGQIKPDLASFDRNGLNQPLLLYNTLCFGSSDCCIVDV